MYVTAIYIYIDTGLLGHEIPRYSFFVDSVFHNPVSTCAYDASVRSANTFSHNDASNYNIYTANINVVKR